MFFTTSKPNCDSNEILNEITTEDTCCPTYSCECDSSLCPSPPTCASDEQIVQIATESCCDEFICTKPACDVYIEKGNHSNITYKFCSSFILSY